MGLADLSGDQVQFYTKKERKLNSTRKKYHALFHYRSSKFHKLESIRLEITNHISLCTRKLHTRELEILGKNNYFLIIS